MRRYAVVQKARDADVIGILIATLGVGGHTSPLSDIIYTVSDRLAPSSQLSSSHFTPPRHHQARAQEVLHYQRGEDQPRKARELP